MTLDREQEGCVMSKQDRARLHALGMLEEKFYEVYGMARVLELASTDALAPNAGYRDLNAIENGITKMREMAEELLNGFCVAYYGKSDADKDA